MSAPELCALLSTRYNCEKRPFYVGSTSNIAQRQKQHSNPFNACELVSVFETTSVKRCREMETYLIHCLTIDSKRPVNECPYSVGLKENARQYYVYLLFPVADTVHKDNEQIAEHAHEAGSDALSHMGRIDIGSVPVVPPMESAAPEGELEVTGHTIETKVPNSSGWVLVFKRRLSGKGKGKYYITFRPPPGYNCVRYRSYKELVDDPAVKAADIERMHVHDRTVRIMISRRHQGEERN